LGASKRARTRASGGSPKRTQTSNASCVSGGGLADSCSCTCTPGCARTKLDTSGATCMRPKPSVAFTRSRPAGLRARALQFALDRRDVGQDAARMLQVGLAFGREADAPRGAAEQARAQVLLELRQPLADCRRRDLQLARRGGQAAATHQRG
jgi:hypothetical protein